MAARQHPGQCVIGCRAGVPLRVLQKQRGLPAEAEYGLSSVFYYIFAAVFFLIPVALAAAETSPVRGFNSAVAVIAVRGDSTT